jgi:hypothetical protein
LGVLVLTIALALFISGPLWWILGSRFAMSEDEQRNQLLNFAAYFVGSLPVSFVLIFFGIGG